MNPGLQINGGTLLASPHNKVYRTLGAMLRLLMYPMLKLVVACPGLSSQILSATV